MSINNYSVHEFILPFTSDFKIDNNIWDKNKEYYFTNDDQFGKDLEKAKIRRYNTLKYFNSSALELLGKDENNKKSIVYKNKTINENTILNVSDENGAEFNLRILNTSLINTLGIYVLRIVCDFDYNKYLEENKEKFKNKTAKKVKFIDAFNIINDLGRRIYLPNILCCNDGIASAAKNNVPKCIKIVEGEKEIKEDFHPTLNSANNYKSKIIKYLLTGKENGCDFNSCLDDRMFVCSSIVDSELEKLIKKNKYRESDSELLYKTAFVDGYFCSCPNVNKRNEDLEKSIYKRWNIWGTLYGVTNYSFISIYNTLGDKETHLLETSVNLYGDMSTIALIERAVAINYINNDTKEYSLLDINNTVYLKEVSEQLQGIELFDMLREQMKLDENIEHLKNKLDLIHNQEEEKSSNLLNVFMAAFSLIALIPINEGLSEYLYGLELLLILAALFLSKKKDNIGKIKTTYILLLVIVAIAYIVNVIIK